MGGAKLQTFRNHRTHSTRNFGKLQGLRLDRHEGRERRLRKARRFLNIKLKFTIYRRKASLEKKKRIDYRRGKRIGENVEFLPRSWKDGNKKTSRTGRIGGKNPFVARVTGNSMKK